MSLAFGLEASDSLPVVSKHDAFDVVESHVESVERCVHALERA